MESRNPMTYYKSLNACILTVTPAVAEEWLTHNHGNRTMDRGLVLKYAADMNAGNFTLNPDAITFDQDGNLVNGQHRLAAIVKSGIPTACVVIYDFPVTRADFLNFDCGKQRTIRARIKLSGNDIPPYVVDIAGMYLRIKYGIASSSASMRLDFIDANRDIIEWAYTIGGGGNTHVRIPAVFMVALIDAKLCGAPGEALQAFARIYRNNDFDGMERYNPKHVIELRDSGKKRDSTPEMVNIVKSRFNAFYNKLQRCYVHDDLYPAPVLPLRAEAEA